jgi:repressor LexA
MKNIPLTLTENEKRVLEFIEGFVQEKGTAPSIKEIKEHFGFASYNSVQRYMKQLQNKNYIYRPGGNQKRSMALLNNSHAVQSSLENRHAFQHSSHDLHLTRETLRPPQGESLSIPLLGKVAAGQPIEAFEYNESVEVPRSFVRKEDQTFALRVQGRSMIDEGIFDGDIILVQKQSSANNGDIVVAVVENEATVKKYFSQKGQIELRPANSEMKSLWFLPGQVRLEGKVVALIRKY